MLEHAQRVGRRAPGGRSDAERANRERDRGVRPLGGAALRAAGGRLAGAQALEELGRVGARGVSVQVRPMSTPA